MDEILLQQGYCPFDSLTCLIKIISLAKLYFLLDQMEFSL